MIRKLKIHALKSIKDMTIDCKNLNLLVGINSSGKSSVIQSILLCKQNSSYGEGLNGQLISLGSFGEIRNFSSNDEDIVISLDDNEGKEFQLSIKEGDNMEDISTLGDTSIIDGEIHYISCHRIGAMDIYQKPSMGKYKFGTEGEYALGCMLQRIDDPLEDELTIKDDKHINTLGDQVNYWLERIINTTISLKDLERTNYLQALYNNNPQNFSLSRFYNRPINIGAGVSYVIGIIITCLLSSKDSIICIENPEIHLHPRAQSELSKFLYFIANAGRQLFVETHSDHIFNGLRVGVANKSMSMDIIAIDFLELNTRTYLTECNPVIIADYGDLYGTNKQMTLENLFDQFDIDIDAMVGL